MLQRVLMRPDMAFIFGRTAVRRHRNLEPPARQPRHQQGEIIGQQSEGADKGDVNIGVHDRGGSSLLNRRS